MVEPPLFVQSIFGILGGIGADPHNLVFMRDTADRLFGGDYVWSVLAAGRHQLAFTTMAGILGGNVRVGLEDSLYIGKGQLATSNAEQVDENPPHPGRSQPGHRDAGRGAQNPQAQGGRPGEVLVKEGQGSAPGPR